MPEYSESDLPSETLSINSRTWRREKFDRDGYQWIREMDDDEYDWNPETDDVSLVGTDTPIRAVNLQFLDGEWHVEGAETAGPDYHRPGFTETISSDFSASVPEGSEAEAFEKVKEFARRLS
ncbi:MULTISPECIES: hypothetical protein [Haloarcula]|uniref:hypothetical protein n=1 Tax=Haloarcula TaxID=2237 RepID=UPI0023EDC4AC|nr:hypothetical protein [Halomicroarcula sp. XH51]